MKSHISLYYTILYSQFIPYFRIALPLPVIPVCFLFFLQFIRYSFQYLFYFILFISLSFSLSLSFFFFFFFFFPFKITTHSLFPNHRPLLVSSSKTFPSSGLSLKK
ncbi:uncharacterized protein SOCG_05253 [Schizosaccharomyces octosporus yFS286]|uniref:Uncharacterized protein n=1 Tax=Schizosaccharomyces octosporus (strain yFS286) TaxID=483514 RepID=S9Q3Y8_SCHOY|nr:uncharacterized protein SOCG_05253 [Schizosaccharomyces octosporus yFS286]EPX74802.1 hypothetical protein SOCG_05253 [Schizosaccharomyces octosporus yFS286]